MELTDTLYITIIVSVLMMLIVGIFGYRSLKKMFSGNIPTEVRSRFLLIVIILFLLSACVIIGFLIISNSTLTFPSIQFEQILFGYSLVMVLSTIGFIVYAEISYRKKRDILLAIEMPSRPFNVYVPFLVLISTLLIVIKDWVEDLETIFLATAIISFSTAVLFSRLSGNLMLVTTNGLYINNLSKINWSQISSYHWVEKVENHAVLGMTVTSKIPFFHTGYLRIPLYQQSRLDTILADQISNGSNPDIELGNPTPRKP